MMRISFPILAICAVAVLAGCETAAPGAPTDLVLAETPRAGEAAGSFDVILAEPAVVVVADAGFAAPVAVGAGTGRVRAGVLTAGDIDDALNLGEFMAYLGGAGRATGLPSANFAAPALAQIVGPDGLPAAGQRVTLRLPGAGTAFYDGFSGVNGMVTVFPALYGAGRSGPFELRVFPEGASAPVVQSLSAGARQVVQLPVGGTMDPDFLDLVFVVDTTGSMADELEWLSRDLNGIVSAARWGFGGVDIRYGLIVYRDLGDDYTVRSYPFTNSAATMRAQLRAQRADGGGDYPEAAAAALNVAMAMDWRRGRGERLVFHIADAPPHDADARAYLGAVQTAAQRDVQIFGLGASGVAAESEYLMRQAAAATGGRYLFLTDDSGVGLTHAEPTISCYQVTLLSDLMVRVLRSELSGQRIEPAPADVIRAVGTYQNGVCRN